MSEPVTNIDIEDVLASIRRLVLQDVPPAGPREEPADPRGRLVLTQALRVAEAAEEEPAGERPDPRAEAAARPSVLVLSTPIALPAEAPGPAPAAAAGYESDFGPEPGPDAADAVEAAEAAAAAAAATVDDLEAALAAWPAPEPEFEPEFQAEPDAAPAPAAEAAVAPPEDAPEALAPPAEAAPARLDRAAGLRRIEARLEAEDIAWEPDGSEALDWSLGALAQSAEPPVFRHRTPERPAERPPERAPEPRFERPARPAARPDHRAAVPPARWPRPRSTTTACAR